MTPKTTNRKVIHDHKWLQLIQATAEIRGQTKQWIYCTRPTKTDPQKPDAVVIVPFLQEHGTTKILLIREFRIPLGQYQLSFPAGLIDPGETTLQAAQRELLEETGYHLDHPIQQSPILTTSAGLTDETYQYLFCKVSYQQTAQPEASEAIEIEKYTLPELTQKLKEPNPICGRAWPICNQYIQANSFPL